MSSVPQKSFVRSAVACGLLLLVLLAAVWLTQGRMAVEKLATALVLPTGAVWLLMLTVLAHLSRNRQRVGAAWLLLVTVSYSVMGSGHVASGIVRLLEKPYLAINPLDTTQHFDAIVLLGGGGGTGANGRLQANASGDRMILAAQLYHLGVTDEIICTGQRIKSISPDSTDPAIISHDVLRALGVPESTISMLGGRNTTEEMDNLGRRFAKTPAIIGLVTSAWHMQRATRLAEKVGFHPLPLPADFRSHADGPSGPTVAGMIESVIPDSGAMLTTCGCCKEYLGMLVGR
jgi:uncharacterized SAM-binding protein YcdF (DUF218 family)